MDNELRRVWKEAGMAKFKALSRHLLGGTEEKPQSGSPVFGTKFETETFRKRSRCDNCNKLVENVSKFTYPGTAKTHMRFMTKLKR
jgi:uncharacterized protein with PIN domain